EVKDAATPAVEAAPAPEHLAAFVRADEHQLVWWRDVEVLAIHLLVRNDDRMWNAGRDRMRRAHGPHGLALAVLAPAKPAARAHQAHEDLRLVSGVQHDESHPVEHPRVHAVDHRVVHTLVRGVTPPREHVGLVQRRLGQAVVGFIERRDAYRDVGGELAPDAVGDGRVHSLGVDLLDRFLVLLVKVFVPDRHAQRRPRHAQIVTVSPVRRIVTGSRSVADSTAAVINAIVPRLRRPDVSGSRPAWIAAANSVTVPHVPVRPGGGSVTTRSSPPRGRTITLSCDGSLSAALVHVTSPFSKSMRHSPAHGVTGPALIQLPR